MKFKKVNLKGINIF